MDILIENASLVDFKQEDLVLANLAIKDGKIAYIGKARPQARQYIDGSGKILSPGFIDIHMHEEKLEDGQYYIAHYMLNMGVTTALAGNCGNNYESLANMEKNQDKYGLPINYLALTGYSELRKAAGATNRYEGSSPEEIEEIIRLYREELAQGSKGLSFGIEYEPGISREEMIEVIQAGGGENILIAAHYRQDANYGNDSIEELIDIARQTKRPMQISHIGSCSAFGYMEESLGLIRQARDQGLDIMTDCYPYDAFSTRIGTSVFDDGCFENWQADYSDILLMEDPYRGQYCNKELFEHVRKTQPDMLVVAFAMNEEEIIQAYREDFVLVASDGLYNRDQGHPRGAGTFPKVLSKYVRSGRLDLIDSLKKMTLYPAQRLGLSGKGSLEVGKDADLVIFDYEKIQDKADFNNPVARPEGIDYVFIGGQVAIDQGQLKDARLGRLIKNQA